MLVTARWRIGIELVGLGVCYGAMGGVVLGGLYGLLLILLAGASVEVIWSWSGLFVLTWFILVAAPLGAIIGAIAGSIVSGVVGGVVALCCLRKRTAIHERDLDRGMIPWMAVIIGALIAMPVFAIVGRTLHLGHIAVVAIVPAVIAASYQYWIAQRLIRDGIALLTTRTTGDVLHPAGGEVDV